MKAAKFWVSTDLIRELLGMPKGAELLDIKINRDTTHFPVEITFTHPQLKDQPEGYGIPLLSVVVRTTTDVSKPAVHQEWELDQIPEFEAGEDSHGNEEKEHLNGTGN